MAKNNIVALVGLGALGLWALAKKKAPVEGTYVCSVCGARFSTSEELVAHIIEYNHFTPAPPGEEIGYGLTCPICGKSFLTFEEVTAHIAIAHPEGPPPEPDPHIEATWTYHDMRLWQNTMSGQITNTYPLTITRHIYVEVETEVAPNVWSPVFYEHKDFWITLAHNQTFEWSYGIGTAGNFNWRFRVRENYNTTYWVYGSS